MRILEVVRRRGEVKRMGDACEGGKRRKGKVIDG